MNAHFVTHLECSLTGEADYPAGVLHGLSRAGRPLLVQYDLPAIKAATDRDEVWARGGGFWKWRELLPVQHGANCIQLGEIDTPLIEAPVAAKAFGFDGRLIVKDDSRLPTGSFKARGLGVAVSKAKELGVTRIAMPTNGNAGAALAAYGKRGGIECFAFCPDETPDVNVQEITMQGARVWRVNGLIDDCGKIVGDGKSAAGWFDISTLKEPYRAEGKKTLGLELAAQMGWQVPDAIFFPTGGGTAVVGMWKAFNELEALGWIGPKRPKMFIAQSDGCAPLVKAFDEGQKHATRWEGAHTTAAGIRVPQAVGDFIVLDIVRRSGGKAYAVPEEEISEATAAVGTKEGLLVCPEAGACFSALTRAVSDGMVTGDDTVMIVNSGSGLKYEMPDTAGRIDRTKAINYDALVAGK